MRIWYSFKNAAVFIIIVYFQPTFEQSFYTAAVVEHVPKREYNYLPWHIILENANIYINFIEQAALMGADIIVFPENGLTTSEVNELYSEHLESYGIEVPSFVKNPCDDSNSFSKVFEIISCTAKERQIYVVINIIEKETINEEESIYNMYSTNYVFDRYGTIIKKYRKINFHNDLGFNNNTEDIVTFTTDFGVTFGLLTSADILYEKPGKMLGQDLQVTDIIYPTACSLQIPFLNGLSIQQGYAKANKINLLTASLNDLSYNITGSGIFLADGSIGNASISATMKSSLLTYKIRISKENRNNSSCMKYDETSKECKFNELQYNFNLINTAIEDMQNYTFEPLNFRNVNKIEGYTNSFCSFTIEIVLTNISKSNYIYKIASFIGTRYFGSGSRTKTIGIGVCALIACLNENITSCGQRNFFAPNLIFTKILIKLDRLPGNNYFQPTTLKYNLFPAIDYNYCFEEHETIIESANPQSSLLSFGIFVRMYDNDEAFVGPIEYHDLWSKKQMKNDNTPEGGIKKYIIIIIAFFVVFITIAVFAICIVKRKKKKNNCSNSYSLISLRSTQVGG